MVKRRDKKSQASQADIEKFVNEADKGGEEALDPKAPRNYKSIAIPFNEYEFKRLEYACEKTGRSKNSLIRYLILQSAQKIEEEGSGLA